MGCIACNKACEEQLSERESFDSIDTVASEKQIHTTLHACHEGVYNVEEPRTPRKMEFEKAKFASSAVVYFNNSRQNPHLNPYSQVISQYPDIYFRHFPYLHWVESGGVFALERQKSNEALRREEGIEALQQTDAFKRHLKITNRLINSVLGIAVTDDISSTASALKRIGAKHAELGIPAKQVHLFRESFLVGLEELLDPDTEVFRIWEMFIKYVVNMIIKGMNDHYKKIMFVYWSVQPRKTCFCLPATAPRKLNCVDQEALPSLKNMAATIEAQQD